ncbi:MAG: UvrD-helicase domain-containing protein [Rikenellaceae bacterium]
MPLCKVQNKVVYLYMAKATIYNASAGSGKTYQLAYKYVKEVIRTPASYRNILAVTFTNKATEEMKSRILRQIVKLASGERSDYMDALCRELPFSEDQIRQRAVEAQGYILHDYSRFAILTIDTFFQRVLRAFIQEIGVDIGYSLEIDSGSIVEQSVDELIEQINSREELRGWLIESINERVEQGQGWDIRRDIVALSGQIFNERAIEAFGEHSREELVESIGRLGTEVDDIMGQIVDISREAQRVMESGGVGCDDFKYGSTSAVQIFRRYLAGEMAKPSKRSRAACVDISILAKSRSAAEAVAAQIQPLLINAVELIDRVQILQNTLQLYRDNMRSFALLSDLYDMVKRVCGDQNTMLLNQTSTLLGAFINEADAPFIYEKVGSRYSRFMIDEFQDTSRREWGNFLPLLRNAISQSDSDEEPILIVGDIKQSIYRWRGGDWRLLGVEARGDLGRGETEVIDMANNYRSLPRIVEFNNEIISRVIEHVSGDLEQDLEQAVTDGSIDRSLYGELRSTIVNAYRDHKQHSPSGDMESGVVEVVSYEEEPPLIERVCGAIDRGYRPCDILILTRTGRDAALVAKILLEFKAANRDERYNFDVMTQEALVIGASAVGRFVIAVMMLSANPEDSIQRAVYNQFLGREYLNCELSSSELELLGRIKMLSPIEAFESIVIEYDLSREVSNIAYIQALHDQVINFSNSRSCDLRLFVEWWWEKGHKRSISVERSESAIEVLTIHKAKGLEKRVVIIPYCDWAMEQRASGAIRPVVWSQEESYYGGLFPVFYRKSMGNSLFAADYHRERVYSVLDSINLLYVALTRAVESLHIFLPVGKRGFDKSVGRVMCDVVGAMAQPGGDGDQLYLSGDPSRGAVSESHSVGGETFIMDRYLSSPTQLRLCIKPERGVKLSTPREMGVLLHSAFEGARRIDDVVQRLSVMRTNGDISPDEHCRLLESLDRVSGDSYLAEWFGDGWDEVLCEREIITPKGDRLRPDRVMISGKRCVVVDYKFGEVDDARHSKQMARYISILSQMGYAPVEGYVWYVGAKGASLVSSIH